MSSVRFGGNIRINNDKTMKITIPRDLVDMIQTVDPDIHFLKSVTVRSEKYDFSLPYPVLASGSGYSHYVLLNAQTVRKHSLMLNDDVDVVVEW